MENWKPKKCSDVWDSKNTVFSIFHSEQKKLKIPSPPYLRRLKAYYGIFFLSLFKAALNDMQ